MTCEIGILKKIKHILVEVLLLPVDAESLGDDEVISDGAILDSVAALEILLRIEEEFEISLEDEQISDALFVSVRSLGDAVCKALAPVDRRGEP
jgi:acyl carrier protein